jgi:hypothetical protein
MKRIAIFVFATLIATAFTALAQQPDRSRGNRPDMGRSEQRPLGDAQRLEAQQRQLQLQARQNELQFEAAVREIELQKKRLELQKMEKALEQPQPQGPAMGMPQGPGPRAGCGPQPPCFGGPQAKWMHHPCAGGFAVMLLVCFIVHILLTVWVYQDIRKRNAGSGIWIAVTLLTGFFGAALYALVRIGDKPQS